MDEIPDDYECLGWFEPPIAKRLLNALDAEQIPVLAEFDDGSGGDEGGFQVAFGGLAQVLIAVETVRRPDADRIHTRLFGSGLPTMTTGGEARGDWSDEIGEAELELHEKRQEILSGIEKLDGQLQALLQEAQAVDEELKDGSQAPERLSALRSAFERHRELGSELLKSKDQLEEGLRKTEKLLYGGEEPS